MFEALNERRTNKNASDVNAPTKILQSLETPQKNNPDNKACLVRPTKISENVFQNIVERPTKYDNAPKNFATALKMC